MLENANGIIFQGLFGLAHANVFMDALIVFFGKYLAYLLAVGWAWFLFARFGGWRSRLMFFVETALAVIVSRGILTEAIRFFFPVVRPFAALKLEPLLLESSNSFPSSHAVILFTVAAIIIYFDRRAGLWFFAFALINGVARVAAGVHWPFDILGGFLVALASAAAIHALLRPYFEKLDSKSIGVHSG